jgi:DNA-binding NarL/FixJ family response regulator
VSGEATNGRDAVALALKVKPDVAIIDYSMPVMNGLEASRRIKLHHLHTEVLILTMHESEEILTEVLLAGVRGLAIITFGLSLVYAWLSWCRILYS